MDRKFKLDDSFKKALEEAVVSDTPASSWMDQYREEYDKLLKSGMFWEFHPTWTGEWDKDKYAFCYNRKQEKTSPQDVPAYRIKEDKIDNLMDTLHRIDETPEERAYRRGWMNGYDEGLYDKEFK